MIKKSFVCGHYNKRFSSKQYQWKHVNYVLCQKQKNLCKYLYNNFGDVIVCPFGCLFASSLLKFVSFFVYLFECKFNIKISNSPSKLQARWGAPSLLHSNSVFSWVQNDRSGFRYTFLTYSGSKYLLERLRGHYLVNVLEHLI